MKTKIKITAVTLLTLTIIGCEPIDTMKNDISTIKSEMASVKEKSEKVIKESSTVKKDCEKRISSSEDAIRSLIDDMKDAQLRIQQFDKAIKDLNGMIQDINGKIDRLQDIINARPRNQQPKQKQQIKIRCSKCSGKGSVVVKDRVTCARCQGSGRVYKNVVSKISGDGCRYGSGREPDYKTYSDQTMKCPNCANGSGLDRNGTGYVIISRSVKCEKCSGNGFTLGEK